MALLGTVPFTFIPVGAGNDVRVSRVPSSPDWRAFALDANWLNGRGSQLVPATFLHSASLSSGSSYTWEMVVFPREQTLERHWRIGAATDGGIFPVRVALTASDGGSARASGSLTGTLEGFLNLTEHVSSSSPTAEVLGLTASFGSIGGHLTQVSIWEVPRAGLSLTRSLDDAVAEGSFSVRSRVWDDGAEGTRSVRAVATAVSSAVSTARKSGILYWLAPVRKTGSINSTDGGVKVATSSATYQNLFPVSASVHTRRVYAGVTASYVDAYILVSSATASRSIYLDFMTTEGRTALTGTLSGANAPQWFNTQFLVRTDGTASSGSATPAKGTDRFQLRFRCSAGTVNIHSLCIGEKLRDY